MLTFYVVCFLSSLSPMRLQLMVRSELHRDGDRPIRFKFGNKAELDCPFSTGRFRFAESTKSPDASHFLATEGLLNCTEKQELITNLSLQAGILLTAEPLRLSASQKYYSRAQKPNSNTDNQLNIRSRAYRDSRID
ncbi:hypothetical protein F5Y07DRAFT_126567 [Xylaria sp. FL0933]|nr:hypothetical protein F5Y07DRAFT_126567 [Xylaria sp. FL0933]